MIGIASIIERFESRYLSQYGASSLPSHARALYAMKRCRTQLAPRMLADCAACGQQRVVPHSCGHRSCPHCQHHESQQWIERQLARQVPATYFMLTFTLPASSGSLPGATRARFTPSCSTAPGKRSTSSATTTRSCKAAPVR